MDFQVVWSGPAARDLETILRDIAANRPRVAERMRAGILKKVELIRAAPLLGARFEADPAGAARETNYKKYRIFYQVREEEGIVEILVVWHGAREDPEGFG